MPEEHIDTHRGPTAVMALLLKQQLAAMELGASMLHAYGQMAQEGLRLQQTLFFAGWRR